LVIIYVLYSKDKLRESQVSHRLSMHTATTAYQNQKSLPLVENEYNVAI